jgi:hypothetical protein
MALYHTAILIHNTTIHIGHSFPNISILQGTASLFIYFSVCTEKYTQKRKPQNTSFQRTDSVQATFVHIRQPSIVLLTSSELLVVPSQLLLIEIKRRTVASGEPGSSS